jgi:hypothetical protein
MNTKTLLAVSLMANAAFLILITAAAKRTPEPSVASVDRFQSNAAPRTTRSAQGTQAMVTPAAAPDIKATPLDWRQVESSDYRQYIANLRAAGCPEKTIRDIIVAEVSELYNQRAKAAFGQTNRFEYWKPGIIYQNLLTEERMATQQELTKEKRQLLKTLLGESYTDKPDVSAFGMTDTYVERLLDFLPTDKQTAMMDLEQRYNSQLLKNLKDPQNVDSTALRTLLAEKDREALQVLGPEQQLEYDLRMSLTAMSLRGQMGDFEPTEQEFREIFKLRKQFDNEFGPAGYSANSDHTSKEERDRRTSAEKEMQSHIKSLLGEDRYREYKFAPDWQRSSLRDVAREYNVPKQTALKVFDIRDEARSEASRLRNDKTLSTDQRQAALSVVRAATETALGEVLGANAARAYVEKGSWIKNLNK